MLLSACVRPTPSRSAACRSTNPSRLFTQRYSPAARAAARASYSRTCSRCAPACDRCGLDYRFIDTGDGPAVFAIFILGFVILGLALYVEFTYEPSVWVHVVLWGLVTPLIALVVLRFLKAMLIALQYRNKAEEGRIARD